jgi:hypothetical protein
MRAVATGGAADAAIIHAATAVLCERGNLVPNLLESFNPFPVL